MRRIALLALMLLAGCTTAQDRQSAMERDADRRIASYSDMTKAYFLCGARAARSIIRAKPGTDPIYVAVAAKGECLRERSDLYEGIQKAHSPEIWLRLLRSADRSFEELAISVAVKG